MWISPLIFLPFLFLRCFCDIQDKFEMYEIVFPFAKKKVNELVKLMLIPKYEPYFTSLPTPFKRFLKIIKVYLEADAEFRDFRYIYQHIGCVSPQDYDDKISIVKRALKNITLDIDEQTEYEFDELIETIKSEQTTAEEYFTLQLKKIARSFANLDYGVDIYAVSSPVIIFNFTFVPETPTIYNQYFFYLAQNLVEWLLSLFVTKKSDQTRVPAICLKSLKNFDNISNELLRKESVSLARLVDYFTDNRRRVVVQTGFQLLTSIHCSLPCQKVNKLFGCKDNSLGEANTLAYTPPTFVATPKPKEKYTTTAATYTRHLNPVQIALPGIMLTSYNIMALGATVVTVVAILILTTIFSIVCFINYKNALATLARYRLVLQQCNDYVHKEYEYLYSLSYVLTELKRSYASFVEDDFNRGSIAIKCAYNPTIYFDYLQRAEELAITLDTYMNNKTQYHEVKQVICDTFSTCDQLKFKF